MLRTNQAFTASPRERCAEHDLAVGPGGECVLCRRARGQAGSGGRSRWLGPALLAASLGTLLLGLLGGAALARTRPPSAPVLAPVGPEEVVRPVPVPLAARPPAAAPMSPHEVLTQPPPVQPLAPPRPPPNYLDEAYAAMPKGNLYDEALSHPAPTQGACPCRTTGCQPRYYGYGIARMPSPSARVPTVQGQVQQASAPPQVVTYGRSGGSLSRGVAVARR